MRTEFLCVSVLRVASGTRVKLASCKSALNLPVVYSTDRSKAVVPVLVLFFFCNLNTTEHLTKNTTMEVPHWNSQS